MMLFAVDVKVRSTLIEKADLLKVNISVKDHQLLTYRKLAQGFPTDEMPTTNGVTK